MSNEELYDKALEAINELYSDMSVSQRHCRIHLRALRDEIDITAFLAIWGFVFGLTALIGMLVLFARLG